MLQFGKYKNKTIDCVYTIDPGYCRWLKTQEHLISRYEEIKDFLNEKFSDGDMSYMLNFGRHKGKTINWIKANDAKYFDWLKSSEYVSNNIPKLKEELAAEF